MKEGTFTIHKPDEYKARQALKEAGIKITTEARGDDPNPIEDIAGWTFDKAFPGTSILSGYVAYVTNDHARAKEVMKQHGIPYFAPFEEISHGYGGANCCGTFVLLLFFLPVLMGGLLVQVVLNL